MYINEKHFTYYVSKDLIKTVTEGSGFLDNARKKVGSFIKKNVTQKDIWGGGVADKMKLMVVGLGGGFLCSSILSTMTGGMGVVSSLFAGSLLGPGLMAANYGTYEKPDVYKSLKMSATGAFIGGLFGFSFNMIDYLMEPKVALLGKALNQFACFLTVYGGVFGHNASLLDYEMAFNIMKPGILGALLCAPLGTVPMLLGAWYAINLQIYGIKSEQSSLKVIDPRLDLVNGLSVSGAGLGLKAISIFCSVTLGPVGEFVGGLMGWVSDGVIFGGAIIPLTIRCVTVLNAKFKVN